MGGPSGAVVTLASGNPLLVSVPASVTILPGANSATFPITTQPGSTASSVPLFASRSITLAVRLTLLAPGSTISSLALSPASVAGGTSSQGTVSLNFTAPSSVVVTLTSSNPAVAAVPASVTVPAGATGASFTVTTASVAANTIATISGTLSGTTKAASLTV